MKSKIHSYVSAIPAAVKCRGWTRVFKGDQLAGLLSGYNPKEWMPIWFGHG